MSMQQVDEYDEDLQLALALSASEADAGKPYKPSAQPGRRAGGIKRPLQPSSDAEQPGPSKRRPGYGGQGSAGRAGGSSPGAAAPATPDTLDSDEAVARALQEEEFGVETQQHQGGPRRHGPSYHQDHSHSQCQVCRKHLPEEQGGGGVFATFWREKYCLSHDSDDTKRCWSCMRLQPQGADWADLGDGRWLCTGCLATLVPDTKECQPLYDEVLEFYASMGMKLPARPPMMLVDKGALNEAEQREGHGQGSNGLQTLCRGMCLSEEYTSIVSVGRVPLPGGAVGGWGPLWGLLPGGYAVAPYPVQLGPSQTDVTAILVLYGFPRLLTGSILVHEVSHAWFRMSGYRGLAQEVEEGLCQLMALLWLEKQALPKGTFEERLASFFAHQIRTDPSPVYGDGFRAAHESFQRHGLKTVLAHVKQTGRLPF